jgi:hypothetical protein
MSLSQPAFFGPDGRLYDGLYRMIPSEEHDIDTSPQFLETLPRAQNYSTYELFESALLAWLSNWQQQLDGVVLPSVGTNGQLCFPEPQPSLYSEMEDYECAMIRWAQLQLSHSTNPSS